MDSNGGRTPTPNQSLAQQAADRIQVLRQELASPELSRVLELTPDQQTRFEDWSRVQLAQLAQRFDVDTSASQKRFSWGMRIASTLGAIAICAAVVLFFIRYWGFLDTWVQIAIVILVPLLALAGAEFAAARERTLYFTGLLALLAFASFVMNLSVIGNIFNINSSERALLAWGAFAMVVAYRYGLRLLLTLGLLLLIGYGAAAASAHLGYRWFDFGDRPELVALLAVLVFCAPFVVNHNRHTDFPPVYRLLSLIVFFVSLLTLAGSGSNSYLPIDTKNVERFYEFVGLTTSAAAIWLGIKRNWNGVVNSSATAFVVFLAIRFCRWWWDWMPRYLFFAVIGLLGIALVLAFKRLRGRMAAAGATP